MTRLPWMPLNKRKVTHGTSASFYFDLFFVFFDVCLVLGHRGSVVFFFTEEKKRWEGQAALYRREVVFADVRYLASQREG
ncbi:hypothetical protein BDV28DRAFT_129376 [Aspergillus coremiiformis]|uniref:Uncharacterized protein n=1 Tax=Aspergillus coremiiformis TaxID=138285 RepID=A0A5N6ZEA3_9EURO|nr:hypothetical protein BDV28DRAFT_129376 [Aspergillus coremiiformis]